VEVFIVVAIIAILAVVVLANITGLAGYGQTQIAEARLVTVAR
jgi:Tfp pilus assembly protein PilE